MTSTSAPATSSTVNIPKPSSTVAFTNNTSPTSVHSSTKPTTTTSSTTSSPTTIPTTSGTSIQRETTANNIITTTIQTTTSTPSTAVSTPTTTTTPTTTETIIPTTSSSTSSPTTSIINTLASSSTEPLITTTSTSTISSTTTPTVTIRSSTSSPPTTPTTVGTSIDTETSTNNIGTTTTFPLSTVSINTTISTPVTTTTPRTTENIKTMTSTSASATSSTVKIPTPSSTVAFTSNTSPTTVHSSTKPTTTTSSTTLSPTTIPTTSGTSIQTETTANNLITTTIQTTTSIPSTAISSPTTTTTSTTTETIIPTTSSSTSSPTTSTINTLASSSTEPLITTTSTSTISSTTTPTVTVRSSTSSPPTTPTTVGTSINTETTTNNIGTTTTIPLSTVSINTTVSTPVMTTTPRTTENIKTMTSTSAPATSSTVNIPTPSSTVALTTNTSSTTVHSSTKPTTTTSSTTSSSTISPNTNKTSIQTNATSNNRITTTIPTTTSKHSTPGSTPIITTSSITTETIIPITNTSTVSPTTTTISTPSSTSTVPITISSSKAATLTTMTSSFSSTSATTSSTSINKETRIKDIHTPITIPVTSVSHNTSIVPLDFMTPTQLAIFTVDSGALNNTTQINQVFNRLETGNTFNNADEYFTTFSARLKSDIIAAVRDVMMNRTFNIISSQFSHFETSNWTSWFTVKLVPLLPSFTAEMLINATSNIRCNNYEVIVQGLSSVSAKMPAVRNQEIAAVMVAFLSQPINHLSCRRNSQTDADWLILNLGQFSTYLSYSELAQFNISGMRVMDLLSSKQKAQFILYPSGVTGNVTVVTAVLNSVLTSSDPKELGNFFRAFNQTAAQMSVTSVPPAVSETILNMTIQALVPRFQTFSPQNFTLWFQSYLPLFLPGIGPNTLSIIPRNISCDSYRQIVAGLNNVYSKLSTTQSQSVFSFILDYLKQQPIQGQSCVQSMSNDSDWLLKNFGQFRIFSSFSDFSRLKSDFNGLTVAPLLTLTQLAQLCSDPSRLSGPQDVNTVMSAISPDQYASFFDILTPNIQRNASLYSSGVKATFLHSVLVSVGLSSPNVDDSVVLQWLTGHLAPLLSSLLPGDVTQYFDVVRNRTCNTIQIALTSLNSLGSALSSSTQAQIFSNIQQLLTGPNGLRCYGGGSFYAFLKSFFPNFGFPDLSIFLSLIPASRQQELLGSISPGELSEFLNRPNTVKNGSELCTLLKNYNQTNQYLQVQPVQSPVLARKTLACVWPLALSASSQVDVDQWFNVRLATYLPYLSSQLISPAQLNSASCLSYKKLVSVLGNNYNFSNTDFTRADVYNSIKTYLTSSSITPRCYDSSDPNLNSTAWFANNFGTFITFITISDLQSFVSDSQIGVFAVNQNNLQLFTTPGIAANVTAYYVAQLYNQNPNFSPLSLPPNLLCWVPASAFVSLGDADSKRILSDINSLCPSVTKEVIAALVSNFNSTLSSDAIKSLGNESIGLTEGQITAAPPAVINSTLPTLSTVTGWNQGQVNAIVQSITNAGFKINSGTSLEALGTLIGGVSTATMSSIPSSELLSVSQNPTFISNIQTAPVVLQETFVQKIVSLDQSQAVVNVPDVLATYIPRVTLASLTSVNVTVIDRKTWNQDQAEVLFGPVASATSNPDDISDLVLQGFTSTSAQVLPVTKAKQVVRACRPRPGRNKVTLQESQLTSMYNYVKDDTSMNFSDFHPDMLLYYTYSNVKDCNSYFRALGAADFSIPSSFLNIQSILFNNAQTCLGISGFSLSKTQVDILGNMTCTLDSSYIQNSDPLIIEKMKNCGSLSDSQVSGIQSLLFSGNTPYGNSSTWNLQTLQQLGNLPLYLDQQFWAKLKPTVQGPFLKSFMPGLRAQKTPVTKLQHLFTACNANSRSRRAAGCTVGDITEATITDGSFPVGYDSTQFDLCLNVTMLTDNLAAITQKVVDPSLERVILNKLNQAYPSGLGDSVLQLLGPTSRVATVNEINSWNITKIDTLASLMNPVNGAWASNQSNAVIMNYLRIPGNTLGPAQVNAIMSNICSLSGSVLSSISSQTLRTANSIDLSSCSIDQKTALYNTANISFSSLRSNTTTYYTLISSYLGGAPLQDIMALSAQNISMDITTFINLNPAVVMNLSVNAVGNLLGVNLPTLKLFENSTVVQSWRVQQYQSQLDTLGIGLNGGKSDPTTLTPTNSTTISTTTTITTTRITTSTLLNSSMSTANNTAGYATVHRDAGLWSLSLFIGLMTVTLHAVR